jgi:hypothetical protein
LGGELHAQVLIEAGKLEEPLLGQLDDGPQTDDQRRGFDTGRRFVYLGRLRHLLLHPSDDPMVPHGIFSNLVRSRAPAAL